MSAPSTGNAFERLSILPNAMNWRGEWVIGDQYYKNDVVVDPNGSSYILLETSSLSGIDPSMNPAWTELSGTSTSIGSVRGGDGIDITGTAFSPTINNNGVIQIFDGTSITIGGTATDPIINSTAVTNVFAGAGISIRGTPPRIFNTGVINVLVGPGITSTSLLGNQYPELVNSGVQSIVLSGLSSSGGQNPTLSNSGVITVKAGKGILLSGNAQSPTVITSSPQLSLIFDVTAGVVDTDPSPIPYGLSVTADYTFTLVDGLFKTMLAVGCPSPSGIFMLDFSSFILEYLTNGILQSVTTIVYLVIDFIDEPTSTVYSAYATFPNVTNEVNGPMTTNLGKLLFNIADARATGLRSVTRIRFINPITSDILLVSASGVWGTYFPLGIQ